MCEPTSRSEFGSKSPSPPCSMEEEKLVSYFFVAGLHLENGIELGRMSSITSSSSAPLERAYKPSILSLFPERRNESTFNDKVLTLCLPSGLRFTAQKDGTALPLSTFHSFANIQDDGARIDGCALIYWEEVRDPAICDAVTALHTQHFAELSGGAVPNVQSSPLASPRTRRRYRHPNSENTNGQLKTGSSHTLPSRGTRGKRSKRPVFYDHLKDKLFVTKAIGVTSPLPVVTALETILRTLFTFIDCPEPPPLPMESYIYWLLHEIPLPPPGRSLKLNLSDTDIVCQRPGQTELPFFDYSLSKVFELLKVDDFLKIYTCVLQERQVLICSKDLQHLMLVSESLCALLFPFQWWPLVYAPIVPYSEGEFLEAPVPFIMGLHYEDRIPEEALQTNICLVDLETRRIELPEDIPELPDRAALTNEILVMMSNYHTGELASHGDHTTFQKSSSRSFEADEESLGNYINNNTQHIHYPTNPSLISSHASNTLSHPGHAPRPPLPPLPINNFIQSNDSVQRVAAIARRAGVHIGIESIQSELESSSAFQSSPTCQAYFRAAKLNNAIREVFLNRFTYMMYSYEHFIIGSYDSHEAWLLNRESTQNFDKASFLSDQPESHLEFLTSFLETHMFTSFIDNKILSQWETPDPNLVLFDQRIKDLKTRFGDSMVRTPTYETTPSFTQTEEKISSRESVLDYVVPAAHAIEGFSPPTDRQHVQGMFPDLVQSVLNSPQDVTQKSPWRDRHKHRPKPETDLSQRYLASTGGGTGSTTTNSKSNRNSSYHPNAEVNSPAQIAQTNWKFVEQLLRETKARTKRMLVEKLGREAVSLGHTDMSITGMEENTLVASFCDLLERVWSHGLNKKQGKSHIWTHLLAHQEAEKCPDAVKPSLNPNFLSPGTGLPPLHASGKDRAKLQPLSILQNLHKDVLPRTQSLLFRTASHILFDKLDLSPNWPSQNNPNNTGDGGSYGTGIQVPPSGHRQHGLTSAASSATLEHPHRPSSAAHRHHHHLSSSAANFYPDSPTKRSGSLPRHAGSQHDPMSSIRPLPTHISYDLKNVLKMTEIKTDIGYARAFVRLSLERKLLHKHLKTLLSNQELLRTLYKRYAFLRCEEEREQFLYHVLSLTAADYRCFTNTFARTKMQYQVLLVPGGKFSSSTSANIWIRVGGIIAQTPVIKIPKGALQFTFEHRNLGVLSTVRIGHDNAGIAPKWYLEYVLIRNEITGHMCKFPCGRWLGKGVDDDSTERLLVADALPLQDTSDAYTLPRTPPRTRSPSIRRASEDPKVRISEVQQLLGEAVNNVVKYFFRPDKQKQSLTQLLCGDKGLVWCLEQAFLVGLRSPRFFKPIYYPWDYIEKVGAWFHELLRDEGSSVAREQQKLMKRYCRLVWKIGQNHNLGKDGMFTTFILISIRDHILAGLVPLMACTTVTGTMYEELSFFRSPHYLTFLSQLLYSINDFTFQLEQSLTLGIEI